MKRQAVITGLGIVSPIGVGIASHESGALGLNRAARDRESSQAESPNKDKVEPVSFSIVFHEKPPI